MKNITFIIILSWLFVHPLLSQEFPVTFSSDSLLLEGTLTLPSGNGPFPVAVFVHGSGPNDRDGTLPATAANFMCLYPGLFGDTIRTYKDLSDALVAEGIATLRYDKRSLTHAASMDPLTASPFDFVEDVHSAVDFVKSQANIDSQCIMLLGHSQGASFIPIVANDRDDIAMVVSLAGPATAIDTLLANQIRFIGTLCGDSTTAAMQSDLILNALTQIRNNTWPSTTPLLGAYPQFWRDWIAINDSVIQQYAALEIPALILQGEEDINVPVSDAERFDQAVPELDVIILPEVNHYLTLADNPNLAQVVGDTLLWWIEQQKNATGILESTGTEVGPFPFRIVTNEGQLQLISEGDLNIEHVMIVDIQGKSIFNQQSGKTTTFDVTTNGWAKGTYVLTVKSAGKSYRQKVLIR